MIYTQSSDKLLLSLKGMYEGAVAPSHLTRSDDIHIEWN